MLPFVSEFGSSGATTMLEAAAKSEMEQSRLFLRMEAWGLVLAGVIGLSFYFLISFSPHLESGTIETICF